MVSKIKYHYGYLGFFIKLTRDLLFHVVSTYPRHKIQYKTTFGGHMSLKRELKAHGKNLM